RGDAAARRDAAGREDQPLRHRGPRGAPRREDADRRNWRAPEVRRDRRREPRSGGAVDRKELRQIGRDRRTLLILVFVPAFFLLLYGYALNWDIRHIALAVQDRDRTPESRALISAFVNSSYFDRVGDAYSPAALDRLLDTNEARAVLVIPEGFAR